MTKRRRLTKVKVSCNSTEDLGNLRSEKVDANEQIVSSHVGQYEADMVDGIGQILDDKDDDQLKSKEIFEKHRGPTILADIWNQHAEEKIVVNFNSHGQPVGDESGLLASFIGTIGRNPELAPQGYADWRLVPKEYKAKCMTEIKLRFVFPKKYEETVNQALGRRVKDYRAELKTYYFEPYKHSRTELVGNRPDRLPEDQWLKLISYWSQEKTKRRATTNTNNQKKMKMPHCAGRKSFARHRAEKAVNGVEPSRAQTFIDFHKDRKTKDKRKIDEESARAVELMKQKLSELPGGVEQKKGQIAWKGDIYDQVINKQERYGQVRGVGFGVTPSKLWGDTSTYQPNRDVSTDVAIELVKKILQEKVVEIEANHQKEIKALQEKNAMELKRVLVKQNFLEEKMTHLISLLTKRSQTETTLINESMVERKKRVAGSFKPDQSKASKMNQVKIEGNKNVKAKWKANTHNKFAHKGAESEGQFTLSSIEILSSKQLKSNVSQCTDLHI